MKKLSILLFYGCLLCAATTDTRAQSGTDGNISWSISDGTLTISGTGAMPDYSNNDAAPWNSYMVPIFTVVIGDDISHIGDWAFANCGSLTSVTIPNSVVSIGSYAFAYCSIGLTPFIILNSVISL